MTPLVVVLCIHSEDLGRGKRHATVEATTEDPNHDVRILAAGFVHGPHGTIGADLAVKVTPKAAAKSAQAKVTAPAKPVVKAAVKTAPKTPAKPVAKAAPAKKLVAKAAPEKKVAVKAPATKAKKASK